MSQSRATVAVSSSAAVATTSTSTSTTTAAAETVANNVNDVVVVANDDDDEAATKQRNAGHDMETINLLDDDDDDNDEDDVAVVEVPMTATTNTTTTTRVPETMNSSSQGSQMAASSSSTTTTTTTANNINDLCDMSRGAGSGNNSNDDIDDGHEEDDDERPTCSFNKCKVQQQQQNRASNLQPTSSVNTTSSSSSSGAGTSSSSSNSSSRHPSDEIITVNDDDDDDDDDNVSSTSAAGAAALIATDPTAATSPTAAVLECPICLLTCVHPTRLPCGHIFCYLCVKGVANKNHRCAMCRRNIPTEFLEHPQLVNGADDINMTKATDDGYQWFYEGRNGWWQYDDRTSQDIEDAYKKGEKSCTILVAGYVYIVDLEAMLQQRQNEPTRCRRVKRDLATIPKKGVAGLRIEGGNIVTAETSSNSGGGSNSHHVLTHMHHMMMPLDYIDDDVGTDANGRSSDIQNISTIAATDAAIRIASDIIGSTLAHADELIRRRNSMPTLASDIVAANSSSGGSSSHMDGGGLYGEQDLSPMAFNLGDRLVGGGGPLPRGELTSPPNIPRSAGQDRRRVFEIYESTLNDFSEYNLQNLIDSSEEDDDEDTHILDMGISLSDLLLGPNHGRPGAVDDGPIVRLPPSEGGRHGEQRSMQHVGQESSAAPSAGESSSETTPTANTTTVTPNRQLRF